MTSSYAVFLYLFKEKRHGFLRASLGFYEVLTLVIPIIEILVDSG